jgi:hypothetical protein
MYEKYESELKSRFKLVRDKDVEEYLRNNLGVHDFIWTLETPTNLTLDIVKGEIPGLLLSKDFLFYVREILGNIQNERIWFKLHPIMDSYMSINDYIDVELDEEKMDRLHKLVVHAPNTTKNLKGLSVSKQLDLFDNVLKAFPNDPFLAISVLEHYIVKEHDLNDDMELLLMELSIRKQILEDTKDKVYHILGIETWDKKSSG